MKKICLYLMLLVVAAGCNKDKNNANTTTTTPLCQQNNEGTVTLHNNTNNVWWYSVPNGNGVTFANPVNSGSTALENLTAGKSYMFTIYYPFTYNGNTYQWNRNTFTTNVQQCTNVDLNINDDCSSHNVGYLVYLNATTTAITLTIDGSSYDPLQPGQVQGYPVAAGVTHSVTGKSSNGNYYSLSPSVGSCQISSTTLQ